MKRRAVIEAAIGETRLALYEGRKLVELHLERWSDAGRPNPGDMYHGRVSEIDKSMGSAFIDLGQNHHGFLAFTQNANMPHLTIGQGVLVEITRTPLQNKGAGLAFREVVDIDKPYRVKKQSFEDMLRARFGDVTFEAGSVSVIESALEPVTALLGGGDIAIDRTRALIAIDVDKGTAKSAYDVSIKAADIITAQLRLRGLGGLIIIDFPNLRQAKQRDALYSHMQKLITSDPAHIKLSPLSRFGVMEMTRAKPRPSLDNIYFEGATYSPKTESLALGALRRLEREGRIHGGAKLTLHVPEHVHKWLEDDRIGWRDALIERIGARFHLALGDETSVSVDR